MHIDYLETSTSSCGGYFPTKLLLTIQCAFPHSTKALVVAFVVNIYFCDHGSFGLRILDIDGKMSECNSYCSQ